MPRKYYHDTDPGGGKPNTVLADRKGPMRGYFNSLPGDYNVNDCEDLNDVFVKYPELFTQTHREAVEDIWTAGGHHLDP